MQIDTITTIALADEFNQTLVDGRVQAVVQTGEQSFGFEIYANQQRHYLFMTAEAQSARCYLTPEKLRRGVEKPTPLQLQLRKYIDGARVMAVSQPDWERILWFDFSSPEGEFRLIVELMGRLSNIILIADGQIFECVKRITPDQNRYRAILPGHEYMPPPPQNKVNPDRVGPELMHNFLAQNEDKPAWRVLVDNIAGVSPVFAREIVYRACDDCQSPAFDLNAKRLHQSLTEMFSDINNKQWLPCVVPAQGQEGYQAFAAYHLTHMENFQPVASINEAVKTYFGAQIGHDPYEQARSTVRQQMDAALDRARRKKEALQRESVDEEMIELLRKKGELIYAYATTLEPQQTSLEAQYDPDAPPIKIELDPTLTPVENAQQYFQRYEKAKRAAQDIPKLQARARHDLAYLEQLSADLNLAESWPEIDMVREALQESGYWQGQRKKSPRSGKPGIRRFTTQDGFVIMVGRNAAQNHTLITTRAAKDDLWLHARNIPGSHVIVKNDGRPIPEDVIMTAAQLAAYYSSARDDNVVDVDVTECRYVRLIRGGRPGMVTFKNERTLSVRPEKMTS